MDTQRENEVNNKLEQLIADGLTYNPMLNDVQIEAYTMGFKCAVDWADKHQSEETIKRVLEVFFTQCEQCISTDDFQHQPKLVDEVVNEIKQHLNDETSSK